ncbi:DUF485 domain-containing protein [Oxalobacteraceae bacterium]|nr:DUF485 domain-containing protein [Oxalobacteraceae bacterium]
MHDDMVQRIKGDPNYRKLVNARSKFGWTLTWCMMAVYYGYILLIAFDKELLSAKTGAGVMTWGMPIGLFVIIFTVLVTGFYVRRANGLYDELTHAIQQKAQA